MTTRALSLAPWCLGVSSALAACAPSAPPQFAFQVSVESDPGVPLAHAKLLRDDAVLGESDARGQLALTLTGNTGENVSLEVQCPAGYRSPEKPLSVVLRQQNTGAAVPEYHASCKPELRSLVVTVRAENGADLPVRYLGRELTRTDRDGAAHVLLRVPPGENLTLELDTSGAAHRTLSPQSPRFTMVMPDHDEVALFDQAFVRPVVKVKREPKPTGPVPILRR